MRRALHVVIQLVIAICAVCGMIAFLWQLQGQKISHEKRVILDAYVASHDSGKQLSFLVKLTNTGPTPIFIDLVVASTNDPRRPTPGSNPQLFRLKMLWADAVNAIPPGGSRTFQSEDFARPIFDAVVRTNADAVVITCQTQTGRSLIVSNFGDGLRRALLKSAEVGDQQVVLREGVLEQWYEYSSTIEKSRAAHSQ